MGQFSVAEKTSANYLDVAANTHGGEKVMLTLAAIERLPEGEVRLLEIGPGGGAAVDSLSECAERGAFPKHSLNLTLIEAPGIRSATLDQAIDRFQRIGECTLS